MGGRLFVSHMVRTVPALDDMRPADEQLVAAYEFISEDGTRGHVELDEWTPVSEIPRQADPSSW